MRRSRVIALLAATALGAGGAWAVAAIPGSDHVIHACYTTNPTPRLQSWGQLRVINPEGDPAVTGETACVTDEVPLSWNQTGPPGAPGVAGARGPAGTNLVAPQALGFSNGGGTFLKLDGVDGESTEKGHKGEIQLESYAFETRPTTTPATRRVAPQDFHFVKKIDKSSAKLFQASVTGKHFKKATIELARRKKDGGQTYMEITLREVLVSSIRTGASHGTPTEDVALSFSKVQESFFAPSGKKLASVGVTLKSPGG